VHPHIYPNTQVRGVFKDALLQSTHSPAQPNLRQVKVGTLSLPKPLLQSARPMDPKKKHTHSHRLPLLLQPTSGMDFLIPTLYSPKPAARHCLRVPETPARAGPATQRPPFPGRAPPCRAPPSRPCVRETGGQKNGDARAPQCGRTTPTPASRERQWRLKVMPYIRLRIFFSKKKFGFSLCPCVP